MAQLLECSLRGSGLILLACLLRAGKAPKQAVSWLWTAAALRLLLPGNAWAIPAPGACRAADALPGGMGAGGGFGFFTALWAAGVGLLALALLLQCGLAHRQIRGAQPLEHPLCRRLIARQGLRRRVELFRCAQIGTPLTCGLLRPRILLPEEMDLTDSQRLACALTHELVHIRRMDALRKGLTRAAFCLHWFNPLAWMLVCLADQDFELACDEKALTLLGEEQKGRYARALLSFAEQDRRPGPLHSGFSLTGQNGLEERIGLIMKYQKISRRAALAAALAVAAAATVSAAELKPAEIEVEAPNAVEADAADANLILENQDGGSEYWTATLADGQKVSYTLNHGHCRNGEDIVYTVGHHSERHHH